MRVNHTEESIASEVLFDYFSSLNNCKVHSWHPPDSKAYFTRLLQIPNDDGKRSHIDLIVQIKNVLYLIEVKDCLCNSYDDVKKLKYIIRRYTTDDLVDLFIKQGALFNIRPIVTRILIAAYKEDDNFIVNNEDISILISNESGVKLINKERL